MRRVQVLCKENRFPGVIMIGCTCAIPDVAEKPVDERIKSGKYIKKKPDEKAKNRTVRKGKFSPSVKV